MSKANAVIIVIDQGTTSTRSISYDLSLNLIFKSQEKNNITYANNGFIESDAEDIINATYKTLINTIKYSLDNKQQILGLAITNQRETVLCWNKMTGKPLSKAISWQDTRGEHICNKIKENPQKLDLIKNTTGLDISSYFSASKIKWLLENSIDIQDSITKGDLCIGTIDSWLLFKLTNHKIFATDHTNASRTMLFDIHKCQWNQELTSLFNIPIDSLASIYPSSHHYGDIYIPEVNKNIPILAMIGDQQSSLVGHNALSPGTTKSTYGTGCFLLQNTGYDLNINKRILTTIAYSDKDEIIYADEAAILDAGAGLEWLYRCNILSNLEETKLLSQKLVNKITNSTNSDQAENYINYIAKTFNTKAALYNLDFNHTPIDFLEAILSNIAFQVKELIQNFRIQSFSDLSIDGGLSQDPYLRIIQANILQKDLITNQNFELTSLGAAKLAIKELEKMSFNQLKTKYEPKIETTDKVTVNSNLQVAINNRFQNWSQDKQIIKSH